MLAGAVEDERVFDLPLPNGDHQRVLYATPPRPWGTIVMLPLGPETPAWRAAETFDMTRTLSSGAGLCRAQEAMRS
jgi:hypothetical protein